MFDFFGSLLEIQSSETSFGFCYLSLVLFDPQTKCFDFISCFINCYFGSINLYFKILNSFFGLIKGLVILLTFFSDRIFIVFQLLDFILKLSYLLINECTSLVSFIFSSSNLSSGLNSIREVILKLVNFFNVLSQFDLKSLPFGEISGDVSFQLLKLSIGGVG